MEHENIKQETAKLGGWVLVQQEDNRLSISLDGAPGYLTIVATDEGFIVDVWPDESNDSAATCCALYTELEPE